MLILFDKLQQRIESYMKFSFCFIFSPFKISNNLLADSSTTIDNLGDSILYDFDSNLCSN